MKPASARPIIGLAFAFLIAWVGVAPATAQQGRKIALVIGNGAYQNVPRLANPGNDARLMAATLSRIGFRVVGGGALLDLDKPRFDRAVQQFGAEIAGSDVALFYYSGHGMQVAGNNWLVPVEANPTRPQDLDFQMVSAELILRQMDGAGTRLNVVILDACRNNPFAGRGLRDTGAGLAQMQAPSGTLISYATQPGNVAQDGAGANSPFTTALADAMQTPGLDIFRMFNQVGLRVKRQTSGVQQPWVSNSPIDGDFYFASNAAAAVPPIQPSFPAPAPQAPPQAPVIIPTMQPAPTDDRGESLIMELKGNCRVRIRLRPDLAPRTVAQVEALTRQGFYNGLSFHRVIDGFMAQGGDPTGTGTGGSSRPNLPPEFSQSAHFLRGTVGAARASDPNSANSQFFIMFAPAPSLDGQYTIFGQVVSGMECVDQVKRGDGPSGSVQAPDRIVRMTVENNY